MARAEQRIISLTIENLKGIRGLNLTFGPNRVMGIFGANCMGKSTILHALACMYKPEIGLLDVNYKFSYFFKRDKFQNWKGSKLHMTYGFCEKRNSSEEKKIFKVHKAKNRWNNDYGRRPPRDVYYIGVDSCIPQIEKEKRGTAIINLEPAEIDIQKNAEIKADLSAVFNRSYDAIFQHKKLAKSQTYNAVRCLNGTNQISYSSLCMGAGEQRVIYILQILYKLPKNSLLLIDEIDLTIHTPALVKLVEILKREANSRNLQIVFTSHREELMNINDIEVRFIQNLNDGTTQCFSDINSSCLDALRMSPTRPLQIYVEDDFAKALTEEVLIEQSMRRKAEVLTFGSASNAFTLMAGMALNGAMTENTIALTDGDVLNTSELREKQIKQSLSGNEKGRDAQRLDILSHILQFNLPRTLNPEQHVHAILKSSNRNNEIVNSAKSINAVLDRHSFINKVVEDMGESKEVGLRAIMREYREANPIEWEKHTQPLRDWLLARQNI